MSLSTSNPPPSKAEYRELVFSYLNTHHLRQCGPVNKKTGTKWVVDCAWPKPVKLWNLEFDETERIYSFLFEANDTRRFWDVDTNAIIRSFGVGTKDKIRAMIDSGHVVLSTNWQFKASFYARVYTDASLTETGKELYRMMKGFRDL